MASKSERIITEALGELSQDTTKVSFTASPTSGTGLDVDSTYRLVATEDVHIRFDITAGAGLTETSTGDALLIGGVPEVFQTGPNTAIGTVRKDTSGDLFLTRMKSSKR